MEYRRIKLEFERLFNTYEIQHFTVTEILDLLTKDDMDNLTFGYIMRIVVIVIIYNAMREDLGFAIRLTSLFRADKHNIDAKGGELSLHKYASAGDAQPWDFDKLKPTRKQLNRVKKMQDWISNANIFLFSTDWKYTNTGIKRPITRKTLGIGKYKTFVHVDFRGAIEHPKSKFAPITWRGKR